MAANRLVKELSKYARKMAYEGLTTGSSGNISVRAGRFMFIKASGSLFEKAGASDFVRVDMNNIKINQKKQPSCEYKLHIACYNERPEIKAIFHTHPLVSTVLYPSGAMRLPVTIEFALYVNKSVGVIGFLPPGSTGLARSAAVAGRKADIIVIKNHGIVALGRTMQEAYLRTMIFEREARTRLIYTIMNKKPACLSKAQIRALTGA
jgi:L-fuculose-phosphate aldolase